jgi:hypothetical protein
MTGTATTLSRRVSLVALFGSILMLPLSQARIAQAAPKEMSAESVREAMRKLWEDHITYTRNYIISALNDLPDADAVAKRLSKNQDDIGNAVKPYYGEAAGRKTGRATERPH